jgi:hypothetical protein
MSEQKFTWCIWSTAESVQNDVPSVTAILETIIAVPLYWRIALRVGMLLPLLISVAIAPLVLLRSEQSVLLGTRWFLKFESDLNNSARSGIYLQPKSQVIFGAFVVLSAAAPLTLASLSPTYTLSYTGFVKFKHSLSALSISSAVAPLHKESKILPASSTDIALIDAPLRLPARRLRLVFSAVGTFW